MNEGGGWVEGIGWVARLSDLDPHDIARNPDGRTAQVRIHRSAGVTPDWGYVTVAGWADGSTPIPPDPFTAVKALPEWRFAVAAVDAVRRTSFGPTIGLEPAAWASTSAVEALSALVAAVEHPEPIDDTPHPGTEGRT